MRALGGWAFSYERGIPVHTPSRSLPGSLPVVEKNGYGDLGQLGQDEPVSGSSEEAPKHQSTKAPKRQSIKATKHQSVVTNVAFEPSALDGGRVSTPPLRSLSERYSVSI